MRKFEYKTLDVKPQDDAGFNELGMDGWELVSALVINAGVGVRYFFKREILEGKQIL